MGRVRVRRATLLLCLASAFACAGEASRGGAIVISTAGDADILFPPVARRTQAREVTDLVFDKLAVLGPGLNTVGDAGWTPRLAARWEWSADSMTATFHLDPRAKWHDGAPVRASDVRFAFQVYTDRALGSAAGTDILAVVDSVSVRDSVTCTAWFRDRTPERFFQLVYNLVPLPEHLIGRVPHDSLTRSGFARAPVGNGPFKLVRWEQASRIEMAANDAYYGQRPGLDRIIWSIVPDARTASERVLAGDADFIENLSVPDLAALKEHPDVKAVLIPTISYAYMLFNSRDGASDKPHPLFADRRVRRALTMALDRRAMVRGLFDTLATVAFGPFSRQQWSADTTIRELPFDRAAAARLLDSAGFTTGADGVRARGGKKLAFSILVPASSAARIQMATILQEQWKQVGAQLDIEKLDDNAMNQRAGSRRFDLLAFRLTSSPSPSGAQQVWTTASITMANGFNLGRWSIPALDTHLDSARFAPSMASAKAHFRAAYQVLSDEAPAIWLYEPIVFGGAGRRLQLAPMLADAWWMSIPGWRVTGGGKVPADAATKPH